MRCVGNDSMLKKMEIKMLGFSRYLLKMTRDIFEQHLNVDLIFYKTFSSLRVQIHTSGLLPTRCYCGTFTVGLVIRVGGTFYSMYTKDDRKSLCSPIAQILSCVIRKCQNVKLKIAGLSVCQCYN